MLRSVGFGLAAVAFAGCLSLVTWSADDPSLTHATSGLTRNWLGPLGAIVSDLMLQTLGFAGVFAYVALAFVGSELILKQRVAGLRLRLWIMPLAVVTLAAALASLPALASWPLNHGLGGMVGDTTFRLLAGLLAMINPARAGMVTGFVMFTSGMCLFSAGLGLTQREWAILWQRSPGASPGNPLTRWIARCVAGASRSVGLTGKARKATAAKPQATSEWSGEEALSGDDFVTGTTPAVPHAAAPAAPAASADVHIATSPSPVYMPGTGPNPAPAARPPVFLATALSGGMRPQQQPLPPPMKPASARPLAARALAERHADPVHRDQTFDHFTDRASFAMAARFAPGGESAAEPTPAAAARKVAGVLGSLFRPAEGGYRRPSLNILRRPAAQRQGAEFSPPVLRGSARLLEDVLADFSIKGEVKDIRPGPVVTLFELEPARGTKSARVVALADDIARSMSAVSARVAVVPGRNAIGIELPNVRRDTVFLREILESEAWRSTDAQLPIVLGKGIGGEPVIADLARMPHLLIAGTTGSGKSVAVNAMILSLLFKHSPAELRLLLIDPKMLELSVYNNIPHLLAPVVTDPHQAAATLGWAVGEMEERYKRMAQLGVRNIEIFNNRVKNAKKRGEYAGRTVQTGFDERTGQAVYEREQVDLEPMPFIVIVVDEFADLMAVAGKEVEGAVQRLAQMARAAGIHLMMATQRPSVDVVTGTIKANFPTRIAFKVASKIDSRTIINEQGAEQLLGAGDMLFAPSAGQILRVHGPLVSDEEVERVAEALRENGDAHYVDFLMQTPAPAAAALEEAAPAKTGAGEDPDDLFDRAVAIVHRDQKASTSYLQRRLSVGYNRAADLIERMEREGLISAADAVGRRRVLIGQAGEFETASETVS